MASKNIAETLKGFVSIHFKYFAAIKPLLYDPFPSIRP
jgi:hypothetical protein